MLESKPIRIILVRHGRTALNAEGRLRGLADPELDEIGVAEATATASALQRLNIGYVVSSPLQRAVSTAAIIAEACGIRNEVDAAFNDRDYGPWTGHVKAEVIRQWGSVDAAPNVEDEAIVLARAMQALNALVGSGDSRPVAVVTHDAVIRPILTGIEPGIDPKVDTGSWAELVHTGDGWTIASVDNTAR
jgi:broad specificity phosphatase PhoE